MTETGKELLECLKDYIKQTETAHLQEGIWFNKVYTDAKELVKKLTLTDVVVPKGTLCKCKKEFIVYNDKEGLNVCTLCGKSELA